MCSENKGADQLCGYREADLRLCFRICKNPVFSRRGSYIKTSFACLICCFKPMVNSEGHVRTVSYSSIFFLGKPPGGNLPVLSAHSFT